LELIGRLYCVHVYFNSTPHAVYSNVREDVQQQQYVFEILWNKATVAEQRIREIDEGIVHYETRIIEDSQIIKEISRLTASSNELYACLTPGGSSIVTIDYANLLSSRALQVT
jgi:hypothetical protein